MQQLTDADIRRAILDGEPARGQSPLGSCFLDLREPAPYVAVAIHAGRRVSSEVADLLAISEAERLREDDPFTDDIIRDAPLTYAARHSRFEYDLNRTGDRVLPLRPEWVWGLRVYRREPDDPLKQRILDRYAEAYGLLHSLVDTVRLRFGGCLVFDVHSYNSRRRPSHANRPPNPTFNIGTEWIDRRRWAPVVDHWKAQLSRFRLPGIETTIAENDVFQGKGAMTAIIGRGHPDTLVLATEIRKVFMDEQTGEVYPDVLDALRQQFAAAAARTAKVFVETLR